MDFISHILIGIIFANLFNLSSSSWILFVVGSFLPDLFLIPLWFYYGGLRPIENFKKHFKKTKKKPLALFKLYDFSHSLLFIFILTLTSLFYKPILLLVLGIIIHVAIDIPLHKKETHAPGIFFPFNKRISGFFDWYDIYYSGRKKLIVNGSLLLVTLLSFYLKGLY